MQPFLLLVGGNYRSIQSVFIVIDSVRYQANSVLKGLDLLFKIFHVLNAAYPKASEHIWTIIQKCIYKIHTPHDKDFPNAMHIINLFKS